MKLGFNLKIAFGKNSANIKMKIVENIVCNSNMDVEPRPAADKNGSNNIAI